MWFGNNQASPLWTHAHSCVNFICSLVFPFGIRFWTEVPLSVPWCGNSLSTWFSTATYGIWRQPITTSFTSWGQNRSFCMTAYGMWGSSAQVLVSNSLTVSGATTIQFVTWVSRLRSITKPYRIWMSYGIRYFPSQ